MVGNDLVADLAARRTQALPCETGGVLLGSVDMVARVIHICLTLAPAPDSVGSTGGFERGISGLHGRLLEIASETSGQLAYVGEWHSHPEGCPTTPSVKDLLQVADLVAMLDLNRTPALMMIVGDHELRILGADVAEGGILALASSTVVTTPAMATHRDVLIQGR